MDSQKKHGLDMGVIVALGLVILGTLLVLEQLNVHLIFNPWHYWPLILVAIGFVQIFQPKETRHWLPGIFLIFVGMLFLASNLKWLPKIHLGFHSFWPFFLMFIGIMLLERHFRTPSAFAAGKDYIRQAAFMGGGTYRYNSSSLKGGTVTAVMGGCVLDLRNADMEGESMTIDTFVVWGGIEIRVPNGWIVEIQGAPILGGIENKTSAPEKNRSHESSMTKTKHLLIKGVVIMGGVEVKN